LFHDALVGFQLLAYDTIVSRYEIIFFSQVNWLILDSFKTCSRHDKSAYQPRWLRFHSGKASKKKLLQNKILGFSRLNVKTSKFLPLR